MDEESVAGDSQCISRRGREVLHQRPSGAARRLEREASARTRPSHGLDCLFRGRLRHPEHGCDLRDGHDSRTRRHSRLDHSKSPRRTPADDDHCSSSMCTVFCMPYPSKTDRQTILSAAVKELAHGGIRDLSLRNIAASLDLAPNAIYRYFSDRSALEAALANEAARQLELALRKAADGCEPVTTIRKMSSAYIRFARDNRHLYEVMMSLHAPDHDATSHQSLWMLRNLRLL